MSSEPSKLPYLAFDPPLEPLPFELPPEVNAMLEQAEKRFQVAASRQFHFEHRQKEKYGKLFVNGEDYGPMAKEKTHWVVEGLLPMGYLAVLGATSKAGKTCFATALAMAVAKGDPFLGFKTYDGAVLWCAYEESESERYKILQQWPDHPRDLFITHQNPLIDDPDGLNGLEYWLEKTEAMLIVIDPLYGATSAESLSDGRAARRALSGLKELCRKHQCAALVLHHITKDVSVGMVRERFADSNQILATASMDMLMDATDLEDGSRLLKISCRGRGDFANQTLYVKSNGVTNFESVTEQEAACLQPGLLEGRIIQFLADSDGPVTSNEIADHLEALPQSIRNCLTRLQQLKLVDTKGKRGRSLLYILRR